MAENFAFLLGAADDQEFEGLVQHFQMTTHGHVAAKDAAEGND